jgi:MinD-like ATPase involved in chromosome partitioning or flagellar assembly
LRRVIGIVSGKGGVGKTTFAANLTISLEHLGKKVVVIDCNVTTPHLAYYLDTDEYYSTINNVLKGEVDIKFALTKCNGFALIPASENLEDLHGINMKDLKNHVRKLADTGIFDFILLDSAPGLGKEALSVLDACEEIIFVTTPVVPNLTDVSRCLEVASGIGIKNFNVVLNMTRGKKFELKHRDAEDFFEFPLLGTIPFDKRVMDSTAKGIPILWYKPGSRITAYYMKIARNLVGIRTESVFNSIFNSFRKFIGKFQKRRNQGLESINWQKK